MTKTTVNKTEFEDSDGYERTQYRTTVPKQLAESFDMEGAKLVWRMGGAANKLEIEVVEDE